MLQQTQVERVLPFYKNFIKQFPTARALAQASLPEVLQAWQGLGYNRRAKYLHEAAKKLRSGEINLTPARSFFASLPGVGPYTSGAIAVFAFNKPEVFIETNIRTVFLHFYFPKKKQVSDAQILPLVKQALKKSKMQPGDFYAALMDYGSHLKKSGVKINARSKHYTKQSKFEGSTRQLRGEILRQLLQKQMTLVQLTKNLFHTAEEVERQLHRLQLDKIVLFARGRWRVAG
jgi:A/G-specific adenine glycosylase